MSFVLAGAVLENEGYKLLGQSTFTRVDTVGQDFQTRQMIAEAYREYQRMVDAGLRSWLRGDPYEICDWSRIFTPIESSAWAAIRDRGLPMWPQFPVGQFSLDFGNPVAKVALECDGKDFHNAIDDAERDHLVRGFGWTTYRAPGWLCHADLYDEDGNQRAESLGYILDSLAEDIAQAAQ